MIIISAADDNLVFFSMKSLAATCTSQCLKNIVVGKNTLCDHLQLVAIHMRQV